MYFIITEVGGQFKSATFANSNDWDEMIASLEGEVIELFQSDKLEPRHFEEYFDFNYRKKKHGKTDSIRNKSKVG